MTKVIRRYTSSLTGVCHDEPAPTHRPRTVPDLTRRPYDHHCLLTDITLQQLLDHMRESMVYSEADLGPFQRRLADLREIVQNDAENHPSAMIELLERKLNQCGKSLSITCPHLTCPPHSKLPHIHAPLSRLHACRLAISFTDVLILRNPHIALCHTRIGSMPPYFRFFSRPFATRTTFKTSDDILKEMMDALSVLSPELVPLHQRLVTMRRQFAALASKEHPSKTELQKLVDDLRKIDAKRVDGKFCVGPGASSVPPSQAICSSLVEDCFDIAHEIKARGYEINLSEELKPVYERLKEMRGELERLSLTHRWTLRETDLYNYAVALRDIDQMRNDGKWNVGGTPDGKPGQGQYVSGVVGNEIGSLTATCRCCCIT